MLKARCATRRGTYVNARLEGYLNCRGDIANADGRLVCREGDILLFEGSYYRGRSLSLNADAANLPRWFNDRASSIRVRRGTWQVCTDWNYRGRCETIRTDVRDLNRIGMNDRISSLRRVWPRPDGSYLQSCRDVEFDGRFLTADCRNRRGRFEESRLDTRNCERGADIFNRNGQLECDERGGYRGDRDNGDPYGDDRYDDGRGDRDVPRGSYLDTCRGAHLDGGGVLPTLRAECPDRHGDWRRTTLALDVCRGRDIRNDDGELACDEPLPPPPPGGPSPRPLPRGSYQQTCRSMDFDRGVLSGECRTPNRGWRTTSLNLRGCTEGADIANDNGALTCAGAAPPPPPPTPPAPPPPVTPAPPPPAPPPPVSPPARPLPQGSYQQSCRNMGVERGTLSGECKTAVGDWHASSLNVRTCAQGADIANDDGMLKCAGASTPAPAAPAPAPSPPPPAPPPPAPPPPAPPPPQANPAPSAESAPPVEPAPQHSGRQPPEGSYQKTCRNFAVERGMLKAECQDASGAWKETSIGLRACRGAPDIANDNGALKCEAPAAVP